MMPGYSHNTEKTNLIKSGNEVTLPESGSLTFRIVLFVLRPLLVGLLVAFALYNFGDTNRYDKEIQSIAADNTIWLYLALVIFCRTITFLNGYPLVVFKKNMKGNIRVNQFIYRQIHTVEEMREAHRDTKEDTVVILDEFGSTGKYNRANRSVHHMVENFGGFVASVYAISGIFPIATFSMICLFCVGRVMHQIGYEKYGFGGHHLGFLLSKTAACIVEGLILIVVFKAMF